MADSGYRRRIILINRKFQFTFAFYVCSWIFVLSLSYPLIIYTQFDYFVRILQEYAVPIPVDRIFKVREELLTLLLVFQLIYLAMTVFISIFLSHRIAGPIYKLSQYFRRSTEMGRLEPNLFFRKTDHFQEIAVDYNRMVSAVQGGEASSGSGSFLKSIEEAANRLESAASQPDQVREIARQIKEQVKNF